MSSHRCGWTKTPAKPSKPQYQAEVGWGVGSVLSCYPQIYQHEGTAASKECLYSILICCCDLMD